jgi:glyoxylase-like metal-dependent hydrolase (beta-lactamase superfamily II)
MMRFLTPVLVLPVALGSVPGARAQHNPYQVHDLAPGVHAVVRGPGPFAESNTLFIISDSDVVVVDANLLPSASREVIAEIRKRTANPVRYVINTHWHSDHHYGNLAYREAYPGVEFVQHPNTRAEILRLDVPALASNLAEAYPAAIARIERELETGRTAQGDSLTPNRRTQRTRLLAQYRQFLTDLTPTSIIPGTVLVSDSLVLVRGERRIVVKYLGRGNTEGDLVVYLPRERIVATGDLVVHPQPFGYLSFYGEWPATLRALERLDAGTIVPGHGLIQSDWSYVDRLIAVIGAIWEQVNRAVASGADLEATRRAVNLDQFREGFNATAGPGKAMFDTHFLAPGVEAAYRELRPDSTTQSDTLRIEVGSPGVDGRVYRAHAARVRVRIGDPDSPVTGEWTNELTLGDSAGRPVMHWLTRGTQFPAGGPPVTWELRQIYDAITLKPYAYHRTTSTGLDSRLTIEGSRVRGTRKLPGNAATETVDVTLDRPGFFAGASDLVPLAVGFKPGRVIIAPVWSPAMTKSETRIFTVIGEEDVEVEGSTVRAWKVEERSAEGRLEATWWLLDRSPYMVYGEAILPDGRVQRMTEVEVPPSGRR